MNLKSGDSKHHGFSLSTFQEIMQPSNYLMPFKPTEESIQRHVVFYPVGTCNYAEFYAQKGIPPVNGC